MEAILKTALTTVTGDRARTYGDVVENHQKIADLWNPIIAFKKGAPLLPADVALMMVQLKVARAYSGAFTPDTPVDISGYGAVYGEIAFRSQ